MAVETRGFPAVKGVGSGSPRTQSVVLVFFLGRPTKLSFSAALARVLLFSSGVGSRAAVRSPLKPRQASLDRREHSETARICKTAEDLP